MKTIYTTIILLFFFMLTAGACNKKDESPQKAEEDRTVISLESIPDNPEYLNMSLERIEWKLIGFGNTETSEIELPLLDEKGRYTILFDTLYEMDMMLGYSDVNQFNAEYEIDTINHKIQFNTFRRTRVRGYGDGEKFIEAASKIYRYKFKLKGLYLYYSEEEYLLMKPFKDSE